MLRDVKRYLPTRRVFAVLILAVLASLVFWIASGWVLMGWLAE